MGCDIHFFVEVKDSNGNWVNNNNCKYICRNYSLFSILANVRNGEGFNYIDSPRGLPLDISLYVKNNAKEFGYGNREIGYGHNYSWLFLRELVEYDWSQIIERSGFVDEISYNEFKKNGKPSSWSGSVMGKMVRLISNKEMEEVKDKDFYYYTEIFWKESYSSCVGDRKSVV